MTKAEQVGLAWEKAYMRGDYSSIEELLHPDYPALITEWAWRLILKLKIIGETVSQFLTHHPSKFSMKMMT